ncbi:hypothetical protein STSO111631_21780 [Stackebrandtia soli]
MNGQISSVVANDVRLTWTPAAPSMRPPYPESETIDVVDLLHARRTDLGTDAVLELWTLHRVVRLLADATLIDRLTVILDIAEGPQ